MVCTTCAPTRGGPPHRPLLQQRQRLAHDRRPFAASGRRVDAGRRAARGRLSHRPLRQVAPGRQPAVPTPRARVRAVGLPRRRRYREFVCAGRSVSPRGYNGRVEYAVTKSATFLRWLRELRDKRARARIAIRIDRVQEGNFGDHKAVGGGVSELRIVVGQGYRVYYTIRDRTVVILLCGGDKSSQQQDIKRAQQIASELSGRQ